MNGKIVTLETMQADHNAWLTVHAQWRLDIERWQQEHATAVARLAEMQKVVREHGACLEEHARAFRTIEDAITAHNQEIANQQAGTSKSPEDVVASRHQEHAAEFRGQQDAHERIKRHHEAVMTQLRALEAAAAAAM